MITIEGLASCYHRHGMEPVIGNFFGLYPDKDAEFAVPRGANIVGILLVEALGVNCSGQIERCGLTDKEVFAWVCETLGLEPE